MGTVRRRVGGVLDRLRRVLVDALRVGMGDAPRAGRAHGVVEVGDLLRRDRSAGERGRVRPAGHHHDRDRHCDHDHRHRDRLPHPPAPCGQGRRLALRRLPPLPRLPLLLAPSAHALRA
ncbi:MAG: hypothetical protein AVDCRST_MAG30-2753 [uncultured Solirubrobacteraceae bacterium]|uniref:Uncharacterized protein n=1 Tax=uncultured Solirubrobacteraceae bacterium TaxID=1162706 RepID=A0A6J4T791_9ACTN|nr:MAG: hypothetical protein AVDCRST_MAG30-2753 [uncultured Solirubrobacteraceae bacterium]